MGKMLSVRGKGLLLGAPGALVALTTAGLRAEGPWSGALPPNSPACQNSVNVFNSIAELLGLVCACETPVFETKTVKAPEHGTLKIQAHSKG